MGRIRIAVFALLVLSASQSVALADCDRPRSARVALERADLVFRGTVREVRELRAEFPLTKGYTQVSTWGWIVTVDVARVWKGDVARTMTLHVATEREDDAFTSFERGREYIVFASVNSARTSARFGGASTTYGATGCGGTVSMLEASPYLLELGVGTPPK